MLKKLWQQWCEAPNDEWDPDMFTPKLKSKSRVHTSSVSAPSEQVAPPPPISLATASGGNTQVYSGTNKSLCNLMPYDSPMRTKVLTMSREDRPSVRPQWEGGPAETSMVSPMVMAEIDGGLYDSREHATFANERRVYTGKWTDPVTDKTYHTFEDDPPPPTGEYQTQGGRHSLRRLQGVDSQTGPYEGLHKQEVSFKDDPEEEPDVERLQDRASLMRQVERSLELNQHSYRPDGNETGEWTKNPAGYVGQQNMVRHTPYLPPTTRGQAENAWGAPCEAQHPHVHDPSSLAQNVHVRETYAEQENPDIMGAGGVNVGGEHVVQQTPEWRQTSRDETGKAGVSFSSSGPQSGQALPKVHAVRSAGVAEEAPPTGASSAHHPAQAVAPHMEASGHNLWMGDAMPMGGGRSHGSIVAVDAHQLPTCREESAPLEAPREFPQNAPVNPAQREREGGRDRAHAAVEHPRVQHHRAGERVEPRVQLAQKLHVAGEERQGADDAHVPLSRVSANVYDVGTDSTRDTHNDSVRGTAVFEAPAPQGHAQDDRVTMPEIQLAVEEEPITALPTALNVRSGSLVRPTPLRFSETSAFDTQKHVQQRQGGDIRLYTEESQRMPDLEHLQDPGLPSHNAIGLVRTETGQVALPTQREQDDRGTDAQRGATVPEIRNPPMHAVQGSSVARDDGEAPPPIMLQQQQSAHEPVYGIPHGPTASAHLRGTQRGRWEDARPVHALKQDMQHVAIHPDVASARTQREHGQATTSIKAGEGARHDPDITTRTRTDRELAGVQSLAGYSVGERHDAEVVLRKEDGAAPLPPQVESAMHVAPMEGAVDRLTRNTEDPGRELSTHAGHGARLYASSEVREPFKYAHVASPRAAYHEGPHEVETHRGELTRGPNANKITAEREPGMGEGYVDRTSCPAHVENYDPRKAEKMERITSPSFSMVVTDRQIPESTQKRSQTQDLGEAWLERSRSPPANSTR